MIESVLAAPVGWLRGLVPGGHPGERSEAGTEVTAEIAERSGTNFYYAFFFLPPARRQALNDVYAYCRLIDDIVDGPGEVAGKAAELLFWRRELQSAFHGGSPTHPVARRLQQAASRFGLRYEDALAVIHGCEMDLTKRRYATWDEVTGYCYDVASSVGMLCIELFGCTDRRSRDYAYHMGQALQLTNILRDVAEDAGRDRLYLPLEALAQHGVAEADLSPGAELSPDQRTRVVRLLSSVARRAREEYRLARLARSERDRRALLPAAIMGQVYFALLAEIERRGITVVLRPGERVRLSRRQKLAAALAAITESLRP